VLLLALLLEDKSDLYTRLEEEENVTWIQVAIAFLLLGDM
jgi:hypothetical protein